MNREQIKYIATFLSNISIGIIVVGVVTPVFNRSKLDFYTISLITISLISGTMIFISGLKYLNNIKDGSKL